MRSRPLLLLFLLANIHTPTSFGQTHWRWRKDGNAEKHASWLAPQDFPVTLPLVPGSSLRLHIASSGGTLQYQRGSGPWTVISHSAPGADFILAGAKEEHEWCIQPTATASVNIRYQFRLSGRGIKQAQHPGAALPGAALPYMMYRPDTPNPGNAGIYRDPLVTGFFDRDTGWIASDAGYSIPLSDGRDLWVMGDSYIDHLDAVTGTIPCLFQVRNAALVQPLGNWDPKSTATRIGKGPGVPSFFKNSSNDNYLLWPAGGYQHGDTVYVYCGDIMNSAGGLGFTPAGKDLLCKMTMPDLTITGFDPLQDFNGIAFGLGFDAEEPDSYIYTWGVKMAYITGNIFVARFPKDDPQAHWSFWNGAAWDTSLAHIAPITTGASNSTYVAKVRNKYVLLSTEFSVSCDQGTRIYVATSDHITGPFTDRKVLYTIPDNIMGHTPFFYAPAIHPEYINAKNELLITYDINTYNSCEPACINNGFNPDYYRPRGLRVPLALIDPGIHLDR